MLLRIRQLRDQLASKRPNDLAAMLDSSINGQRETIASIRALLESIASTGDPNAVDQYRSEFQQLAVKQRVALSDLQDVVDNAAVELESLEAKADDELTPEERIRIGQLNSLLEFVEQGRQRIGQSRSQLRFRQASRAFRRASSGLNQLKRGRDQLRTPLEWIDVILKDTNTLAQETAAMSVAAQSVPGSQKAFKIPAWIDQQYLSESQAALTARPGELTLRMQAGLANPPENASDESADGEFLIKLESAMPFLTAASESMNRAQNEMDIQRYTEAATDQTEAIKALQEARERFADLRTLIELTYRASVEIAETLEHVSYTHLRAHETRYTIA